MCRRRHFRTLLYPRSRKAGPDEHPIGRAASVVTVGASGIGEAPPGPARARGHRGRRRRQLRRRGRGGAPAGRRACRRGGLADFDAAALAGQADVWVDCAGLRVAPVHEFPPERFRLLLAVLLEAPFRLAQAALPPPCTPAASAGSSTSPGVRPRASPYKAAYVAANTAGGAVEGEIALEGGEHGVTSNRSARRTCARRRRKSNRGPGPDPPHFRAGRDREGHAPPPAVERLIRATRPRSPSSRPTSAPRPQSFANGLMGPGRGLVGP